MDELNQHADFEKVLETHKGIIYKVAAAYCRNAEDRKDLIQEITIQIWNSLPRYDPNYKLSTWIYRIALNVSISWYRKSKKQQQVVSLEEAPHSLIDESRLEKTKGQISQLYRFLGTLKEMDKALMLLYLDEKSHAEIAEILGISKTNVGTKISRIKKKLQQQFESLNQE